MDFLTIPTLDVLLSNVKMDNLSPSTYLWMKEHCAFQSILSKALSKGAALPLPPQTILGTISHKLCEYALKKDVSEVSQLVEQWEYLTKTETETSRSTYPMLKNCTIQDYMQRNRTIKIASKYLTIQNKEEVVNSSRRSEFRIQNDTLHIIGTIDRIDESTQGAQIYDYKFGKIYNENGEIKKEYVTQLNLYAILFETLKEENKGKIDRLALINSEGEYLDVPIMRNEWRGMIEEIQIFYNETKYNIDKKDWDRMAKPNEEDCSYCRCRHVCPFAQLLNVDVFCTKKGILKTIEYGNIMTLLDYDKIEFKVYGINEYDIENIYNYIDSTLAFVNINKIEDGYYRMCSNSLVYKLK